MDAPAVQASIDPRAALAALGYPETTEPVPVLGGWDTLMWRFKTADGGAHSLRVHYLPDREEFARRERIAMGACAAAGLPAPRVEASDHFEGLPAMVLSWCPGRPILSFIEKRPWTLLRMSRLLGRAQARLHAVPPPPEFVAGAPDDWLSRVGDQYADLVAHARTLGLATTSLIHMDFHPLNVVSDGKAVTGVLDWARSGAGDPRADLARTEIIILAAPVPPGPLKPILNLSRSLLLRSWRAGYRDLAGPLPHYRQLRAWAGATLLAEMEMVIDKPEVWGTQEDIERFRALVDAWAREYGIR
jgi:aminoglycoside phosphotransferase (APT) family kinase protein